MPDEIEQRVLDDIKRFGWHLIVVNPDEGGPGFVYSIGLMQTLSHPEIIVFSLEAELMASVVNDMGQQVREGRNFAELGLFEDVLSGYACKMIRVAERHQPEYLGYAMWHRRHLGKIGTLEVLQCLWPDRAGKFPDDPTCHPEVKARQPLLV